MTEANGDSFVSDNPQPSEGFWGFVPLEGVLVPPEKSSLGGLDKSARHACKTIVSLIEDHFPPDYVIKCIAYFPDSKGIMRVILPLPQNGLTSLEG